MAADGGVHRALRDESVRRLVALRLDGSLSRAQVALVARDLEVSERTVWRWVAQAAGDQADPAARERFVLDDGLRARLSFWRGNVSALYRELCEAEAGGGAPAPSLPTLHRAVRDGRTPPERAGAALPDPGSAVCLDDLVARLRLLKAWAGNLSYDTIKNRVNAMWAAVGRPAAELAGRTTVVDCFRTGRRRVNAELVEAIVRVLHPDAGYVSQWRQALQVIAGGAAAASQVRVQDHLPPELAGFTGRDAELERFRHVLAAGPPDGPAAVVLTAIEGMAGVGKTQLAVHLGHLLLRERRFDRVLFVNLRGFHPDSAQPPADPAAVLDGFLRLLKVPGQQIPNDLDGRAARYRSLLAGTRTLVVLDNAATADQVRPLLPELPGCPALVTSRRSLSDLRPATHLLVDVFSPDEARRFLARAAPGVPAGDDPDAVARIAARCGYLPLALGLAAGHIRARSGWTLTDHADWLDERHRSGRLEAGLELALDVSYRHVPDERRRLLRLAALHPGQDFDAFAAAALAGAGLDAARAHLDQLCEDHLLQHGTGGRYNFHDLVRAYASTRAFDQERLRDRHAALTRLFDHYLATAAAAITALDPVEARSWPEIPAPGTPAPEITGPDTARGWLHAERPNLVAVAAHTSANGWPGHAVRISQVLSSYLEGGFYADATSVHGYARDAARSVDDQVGQARALARLGATYYRLGRLESAVECLQRARELSGQGDDRAGQAEAELTLGHVEARLGHRQPADDHYRRALALYRQIGDLGGEARTLTNLAAILEAPWGWYEQAAEHYARALALSRQIGDRTGQARTLTNLSVLEVRRGQYLAAAGHLQEALSLASQLGNRTGVAYILSNLGLVHLRLGRPAKAIGFLHQAIAMFQENGERPSESAARVYLGEATFAAGRVDEAVTQYAAAEAIAVEIGDLGRQANAHTGLGQAHHALGNRALAHEHYRQALALYTGLGRPEADEVRACLGALDDGGG